MTTDPGDLVFDPTCGSGTTAYVAEQRGRHRLMTATFPYYRLAQPDEDCALKPHRYGTHGI
jgi:adenine-specific DNA-methyltransferase